MKRITVGVLAHVDSGKTTLTEALLYTAGVRKTLGRVDHGDAFLDTHAIERARGITIFSKTARLSFGDTQFTLLDTPGHVDFSAETERTLQVLDYAVLVVGCTDGVQSHTRTLWRLLQRYGVPCFLFVNKTDLPGADPRETLAALKKELSPCCVDCSGGITDAFYEDAALCDETLLERYEQTGALTEDELAAAIKARKIFPCFCGSALKLQGISEFLSALDRFTRMPVYGPDFAARVYKLAEDKNGARLTFLKLTGGVLRVREILPSAKNAAGEKVSAIRFYSGEKFTAAEQAQAGDVVAVTGVTFAAPGDGLGAEPGGALPVLEPVAAYGVTLPEGADPHRALDALRALEAEDPLLHVEWDPHAGISVRLMGDVQLEVLKTLLESRFSLSLSFGQGRILYKETISKTAEGVGHFEPLRHYAEVHLLLKPGKRGSGLVFRSACREDQLDKNWQRLILTHLAEKRHAGVLTGAPLTDVEITLVSGRAHEKHTEGGDFRQATYRAVRQGLRFADPVLLEPFYAFTLELPLSAVGRALTDLERMGAAVSGQEQEEIFTRISGRAPAAALWNYGAAVREYTRGAGRLSCTFDGYAPCENAAAVIEAAGYDPDADPENPCDSVFCSHGAGHTVKWNEVPRYMHLPSALHPPRREEEAPVSPAPQRAGGGKPDLFALDRELMQIFAKTYGPVKNRTDPYDLYKAFRKDGGGKKQKEPKIPATYTGTEYLLVDGYNVIYAWEELRALSGKSLSDARDALLRLLCNYRGYKNVEVILVFDAYKVKGTVREIETVGNVSVVYTKEAETADTYIEKTSHELAKNNRVRVVTSDGMEQIIILGNGALRVSAEAFHEELSETQREIRAELERLH